MKSLLLVCLLSVLAYASPQFEQDSEPDFPLATGEEAKLASARLLEFFAAVEDENVQMPADMPLYNALPTDVQFTCIDKVPGYYANVNYGCQVYHMCRDDPEHGVATFLCPNATVFHQSIFACDWWFNVDCASSPNFYYLNEDIYKDPEEEVGADGNQYVRHFNSRIKRNTPVLLDYATVNNRKIDITVREVDPPQYNEDLNPEKERLLLKKEISPDGEYIPPNDVLNNGYLPPKKNLPNGNPPPNDVPGKGYLSPSKNVPDSEYLPPNYFPGSEYLPPNKIVPGGEYLPPKDVPLNGYLPLKKNVPDGEYLPPNDFPRSGYIPPNKNVPDSGYLPPSDVPESGYLPPKYGIPNGEYLPPQNVPISGYLPPKRNVPDGEYLPPKDVSVNGYLLPEKTAPEGEYHH